MPRSASRCAKMVPSLRRLDRPQAGMEHPRDPCRAARSPDLAPVGMKASRGRTRRTTGKRPRPATPKAKSAGQAPSQSSPLPSDFTLSERQIPKQQLGSCRKQEGNSVEAYRSLAFVHRHPKLDSLFRRRIKSQRLVIGLGPPELRPAPSVIHRAIELRSCFIPGGLPPSNS